MPDVWGGHRFRVSWRAWWWLALVLGLLSHVAAAQPSTSWLRDPVLSPLLIQAMTTDRAGLRWVATDEGLYRYDGYELTPLAAFVREGPRLPLALIRALVLDHRGQLWFGGDAGLFRFSPATGQLLAVPLPAKVNAPRQASVSALRVHPRTGTLWVSVGNYVFALAPDQPRRPLFVPYYLGMAHYCEPAADGGVWVLGYQPDNLSLAHLSMAGSLRRQPAWQQLNPIPNSRPVRFFDRRGLYELTATGQRRTVAQWAVPLPVETGRLLQQPPIFTDSTATYLVGRTLVQLTGLRGSHPKSSLTAFAPVPDAPGTRYGYFLQADSHGTWWAWSPYWRGCFKRRRSRLLVKPVNLAGGQPVGSTRAIGRLPDGRLFVSTYNGTFTQAADSPSAPLRPYTIWQQWHPHRLRQRESSYLALLPLPATKQLLLAGETYGVTGIDSRTGLRELQIALPYTTQRTLALLRDHRGRIWGGTEAGLFELDLSSRTYKRYGNALPGQPLARLLINGLAEDAANEALWLATPTGLFWLQPRTQRLRRFGTTQPAASRLPTDALLAVATAGPGRVWVGTHDQGLLLVDARSGLVRQLSVGEGLPSHTVAVVLLDARGYVWAGSYDGLARYSPTSGQLVVLRETEGLPSAEFNRWAAFRDQDNSLWFGSIAGVVHLDPRLVTADAARQPPRLLVTARRQADGQVVRTVPVRPGTVPSLRLPGGVGAAAEVRLALTDLLAPELSQYEYRLLDPGGQPQTAWLTTPRALVLRGLPAGEYLLEVRGSTALGQAAANHLRLPLRVQAAWWQQPVVWALAAALLVGLGYGLHWLRLRRVRRRELREALLRTELAANLHDEVGALLTRVNLLAEVLREEHQPVGETGGPTPATAFDRLLLNSRAAAQTMRDVVWGIDARADSVGGLIDRMRDHLDQTAKAAGIRATFRHENLDAATRLPTAVRQHLYLIFKEAVTNAVRHGQGVTKIRARLARATGGTLVLEVTDNGQSHPSAGAPKSGMGLRNMTQRAATLGATLTIGPRPDGLPGYHVRVVSRS